jgi:N-glycosylase/DNA lyase
MEITIPSPTSFSFKRTVLSHGWYDLLPFEFDSKKWTLARVLQLDGAQPVTVTVSSAGRGLRVVPSRRLRKREVERIAANVRHMFRLDDNFAPFYAFVARDGEFRWIARSGAGRLLRSPTMFEDVVKMICTTNCSWALTNKMVTGLVNSLGAESDDGRKAFPTAGAMAAMPERFFRDEIRAGYRAPYLKELAQRVASGSLDLEGWLLGDLSTPELLKQMKGVKGVGNYAAENLLRLVGRYDGLALDSWVRGEFARTRNGGRKASDKKIERFYARFGPWRGLVLWCDMTRNWLNADESSGKW